MTWFEFFKFAAEIAPLGTAAIALTAAIIASIAIIAQRDIARRRAAVDFFLKTEMDAALVDLYHKFKDVAPTLKSFRSFSKFSKTQKYKDVRAFLNICELIAAGVNYGAFSNKVSWAYWGDILPYSYAPQSRREQPCF